MFTFDSLRAVYVKKPEELSKPEGYVSEYINLKSKENMHLTKADLK